MSIWTPTGAGSYYSTFTIAHELCRLECNGTAYLKVTSITTCDSTNGSFFHDMDNQRLYINNTGGDSPRNSLYTYVGFSFICLTDREDETYPAIYQSTAQEAAGPKGSTVSATRKIFYKPLLDEDSLTFIRLKVAEYYTGVLNTNFGNLDFTNLYFWYNLKKQGFNFHNQKISIKIGEINTAYANFVTIFVGRTLNPSFSENGMSLEIQDIRAGAMKTIPSSKYTLTSYPNLDPSLENKPIPYLFGIKTGIILDYVDTVSFIFKISLTDPACAIQSVDHVYLNGVEIFSPGDYTANLANATITLTADPLGAVVTADAHGLQCQFNFALGTLTGVFSENAADILAYLMIYECLIPTTEIDLAAFALLQTNKTQRLGYFLYKETSFIDFLRLLQQSALFHLIPALNGKYSVKYYDRELTGSEKTFYYYDFSPNSFLVNENTGANFYEVILKYNQDPRDDEIWKTIYQNDLRIQRLYNQKESLIIETMLVDDTEASALCDFYFGLIEQPTRILKGNLISQGLEFVPSDKFKLTYDIVDSESGELNICEDEIYLILEASKNLKNMSTQIEAILDVHATGSAVYSDRDYLDHTDDYNDHGDSAHGDHSDYVMHQDHDDYDDIPYVDDHQDIPYTDHDDAVHSDGYDDHTDGVHHDKYSDIPYVDHTDSVTEYIDTYTDTPHTDHDDHSDVHHTDSHLDGHDDHDDHTDSHTDSPHVDSWI